MLRLGRIGAIVVIGATAVAAVPPTAAGAVADTSGSQDVQKLMVKASPVSMTAADGATVAAACNRYTRTQVCRVTNLTVTVLRRGRPVGRLTARLTQAIRFNTKSRNFRESIAMTTTGISGQATGIRETFAVSCGNPCKARNNFPSGRVLRKGDTIRGKIAYTDGVKTGKVHSTASRYTLTSVKPGYTIGRSVWKSIGYRCDDKIKNQNAGCVIPRAIAIMTSMRKLPHIAANIRRIQNNSPGHYGRPGSGHPLHRLMNKRLQRKNRNAVCSRRVVGPPPRPGLECDEYPFASAKEGGTKLSKKNRGVAWVPATEQRKQAGYIPSDHNAQRVLDGEAFYVAV